ncbi:MAG: hypothetical protein ACI4RD_02930 [Kiritimatiellia bacterium]
MTLERIQQTVLDALRNHHQRKGVFVPVIAEDEGNVVSERDAAFARTHIACTVGAASFAPKSKDSAVIFGTARIDVTVWERPTRNRVGQPSGGPTSAEEAEIVACALHLLPYDGGVIVLTGIGGVVRSDGGTISRTVTFETDATLSGA